MAFRYQGGFIGPERSGTGKYLYPGASFRYVLRPPPLYSKDESNNEAH